MKYGHNIRNIAQKFMFADIKEKAKILSLTLELSHVSDAGCWKLLLHRFFHPPAAGSAYFTLFMGCAAHQAALMIQFSQFSDHFQPPCPGVLVCDF